MPFFVLFLLRCSLCKTVHKTSCRLVATKKHKGSQRNFHVVAFKLKLPASEVLVGYLYSCIVIMQLPQTCISLGPLGTCQDWPTSIKISLRPLGACLQIANFNRYKFRAVLDRLGYTLHRSQIVISVNFNHFNQNI